MITLSPSVTCLPGVTLLICDGVTDDNVTTPAGDVLVAVVNVSIAVDNVLVITTGPAVLDISVISLSVVTASELGLRGLFANFIFFPLFCGCRVLLGVGMLGSISFTSPKDLIPNNLHLTSWELEVLQSRVSSEYNIIQGVPEKNAQIL